VILRASAAGLLLVLLACRYEFSRDEAKALVRSIGEERIRDASDALTVGADRVWPYRQPTSALPSNALQLTKETASTT